ncbi:hypothetical protein ALO69_200028 [Pseudomonas ficuserectae]|nr:hypothetical protein ALO69_200028 [Pseudomonas ficuserectae]RMS38246.1 hypothetical protein ALP67_200020 [Pseudomonas ficuserectae]
MRSFYSKEKHCLLERRCALSNRTLVPEGLLAAAGCVVTVFQAFWKVL